MHVRPFKSSCTEPESSDCKHSVDVEPSGDSCECCLSRGQQLWFSQVTREYETNVLSVYRELGRRVDLVEICAPWDSPLSQAVIDAGGTVERWGCHNGYDLSTKSGCVKALKRLKQVRPRYVHISPPCDPWSIMQNANQRTQDQVQNLIEKQKYGRRILKNCRKIVAMQRQEIRGDAGGEQPLRAMSWKEPSVRHMLQLCGSRFRCDGCMFGMKNPKTGHLLQKSWGWFSSSEHIRQVLQRTCQHKPSDHDLIEGDITSGTAVYPEQLCRAFARTLMSSSIQFGEIMNNVKQSGIFVHEGGQLPSDRDQLDRVVDNVEDADEYEPSILDEPANQGQPVADSKESDQAEDPPDAWGPDKIRARLRTIHANLGHPSNQVLCRMLKDANARADIIEAARNFECDFCRRRGHAEMHRPSGVTRPNDKWI